ncbi:MAG: hypothetical protein Q6L68_12730, partial [Thermostichus sp. DG02_5_bins_236]
MVKQANIKLTHWGKDFAANWRGRSTKTKTSNTSGDATALGLQSEIFQPRTRFDGGGQVVAVFSEFDESSLNVFAEVGLTDRLTLNLNMAYVFLENHFASNE